MLISTNYFKENTHFLPEPPEDTETSTQTPNEPSLLQVTETALANKYPDSPLLKLPAEVVLNILNFLRPKEMGNAAITCQGLNAIIKNEVIWQELFARVFPKTPIPPSKESCLDAIKSHVRFTSNLTKGVYTVKVHKVLNFFWYFGS